MTKEIEITIPASEIDNKQIITQAIIIQENISPNSLSGYKIIRRSLDARRKPILYILRLTIFVNEPVSNIKFDINYQLQDVSNKKPVIIIGAGPAGLFAALKLIELGIKPIIFERGKDVNNRKIDIAAINRNISINTESNWCFGEGGAGTFSDGKLYTRSTKRGDVSSVLDILIAHGANQEISIDAHAHIGTDKLPAIITNIRHSIILCGGEVHFDTKIIDILTENNKVTSIIDGEGNQHKAEAYILATGHSASDIYELFFDKKIKLELKSYALGVRVEHPQSLIDSIQYKLPKRPEYLPAANYSLVQQVDSRGVFSFCMCPGGVIVPASTHPDQLVVNGMSNSQRNSPFANAGIVVSVEHSDLHNYDKYHELAGLKFQQEIEYKAWLAGGKSISAPAQRMDDFVNNRISNTLPNNSYNPGLISADLSSVLPDFISERLKKAFVLFNNKMRGFYTNDAILVGVESRTSSPVRIPRDSQNLNHIEINNLYPAGEGAGYAGGIVSSAIDGQRCAESIANRI